MRLVFDTWKSCKLPNDIVKDEATKMSSGCVYTHPFSRCEKGQSVSFHIISIRDYYIHIGVGSYVVCSIPKAMREPQLVERIAR